MTTLAEYKVRLAAMFAEVSGVTTAVSRMPRVIKHAELPIMIPTTGASNYDTRSMGEQSVVDNRILTATLYVAEADNDVEYAGEEAAEAFIPLVKAYMLGRPGMTTSAQSGIVYDMELVGDGGVISRPYPANSQQFFYIAVPFYFRIKLWDQISYKE